MADNINNENNISFFGKCVQFPKDVQIHKAYMFLENIKVSKSKLWYIITQRQDNELLCVKYNKFAEINLETLIETLKTYYLNTYELSDEVKESIEAISIVGEDKFVVVRNIPKLEVDGKSIISKITEDIINILA